MTLFLQAALPQGCVVDPEREVVIVHDADHPGRALTASEALVLPEWIGGWRIGVHRLFE